MTWKISMDDPLDLGRECYLLDEFEGHKCVQCLVDDELSEMNSVYDVADGVVTRVGWACGDRLWDRTLWEGWLL